MHSADLVFSTQVPRRHMPVAQSSSCLQAAINACGATHSPARSMRPAAHGPQAASATASVPAFAPGTACVLQVRPWGGLPASAVIDPSVVCVVLGGAIRAPDYVLMARAD